MNPRGMRGGGPGSRGGTSKSTQRRMRQGGGGYVRDQAHLHSILSKRKALGEHAFAHNLDEKGIKALVNKHVPHKENVLRVDVHESVVHHTNKLRKAAGQPTIRMKGYHST